ncbi:MAG: hypothetical protein FRX49_03011 [Trebouxia sp. A1-2]|nr:MAG: hypothetical protein FRX49_03011 [Trebouxia sp. A1-2]
MANKTDMKHVMMSDVLATMVRLGSMCQKDRDSASDWHIRSAQCRLYESLGQIQLVMAIIPSRQLLELHNTADAMDRSGAFCWHGSNTEEEHLRSLVVSDEL